MLIFMSGISSYNTTTVLFNIVPVDTAGFSDSDIGP